MTEGDTVTVLTVVPVDMVPSLVEMEPGSEDSCEEAGDDTIVELPIVLFAQVEEKYVLVLGVPSIPVLEIVEEPT